MQVVPSVGANLVFALFRWERGRTRGSPLLKCLWNELPLLSAQEVHHLSFAVEAHPLARHLARVFQGGGADNFFPLRDIRAVHAERVEPESQEQESVQRIARHFTTDAHADPG